jgi:hypothetical protein
MNRRHEGIEARRHEAVAKAIRDQVRRTHPHFLPPRLVPTPCLRAFVPTRLVFPPSFTPARTKAHHPPRARGKTNPPSSQDSALRTLHAPAHQAAPSPRARRRTNPPRPRHLPSTILPSSPPIPLPQRAKPFQTVPKRPITSNRKNKATCHFGSHSALRTRNSKLPNPLASKPIPCHHGSFL